jgi:hypothetical protein
MLRTMGRLDEVKANEKRHHCPFHRSEASGMPTLPIKFPQECDDNGGRSCVMREDYDEIGHYVGSLSRILLLIAVIIAVPLFLSTITAFVRNQSNVSTFHDLLAIASVNALGRTTKVQSTPRQAKLADPQEAKTTERAAPAGPLLVDYPPDAPPSAPSMAQIADTSSPLAATSNSGTPPVAKGADGLSPPGAASDRTDAVTPIEPVGTTKAEADGLSASAPLSEPIRLPRPRPHDGGTIRKADTTLSRLPMPRPRPLGGGSGAQKETTNTNSTVPLQQQ